MEFVWKGLTVDEPDARLDHVLAEGAVEKDERSSAEEVLVGLVQSSDEEAKANAVAIGLSREPDVAGAQVVPPIS